jgi:peptide/nickel transport system substrate-binding protein
MIPDLAQSYSVSPDGLSITVNLFHNVSWQDGVPFTSADVKFSVELSTAIGPWMGSLIYPITIPTNTTRSGLMVRPGAITTPDNYTVVFHLPYAYAPFPLMVGGITNIAILPQHILQGHDIATSQDYINSHVVGTGPFKLQEYVPGDHITLVAYDNFHLGRPHLDTVIFKFYKNMAAAEIALKSGEIGLLPSIPVTDIQTLNSTNNLMVSAASQFAWDKVIYNLNPKLADGSPNPVANIQVRRAIQQALNVSAIVESLDQGLGQMANQETYPGAMGYNASIPNPILPYDVNASNQLLDQAGYPRGSDGTRFSLTLFIDSSNLQFVKAAEIIQSYLKVVGINLVIQLLESSTYYQMTTGAPQPKSFNMAMNYEVWSLPYDADYPHEDYAGDLADTSAGGINIGNYNNTMVNSLLIQARQTTDPQVRNKMYERIQGIIANDLAYTFLDYPPALWAYQKNLVFTPGPRDLGQVSPNALRDAYFTSTSETSTQVTTGTQTPTMDMTTIATMAVVIVVIIAAVALTRRKKESESKEI